MAVDPANAAAAYRANVVGRAAGMEPGSMPKGLSGINEGGGIEPRSSFVDLVRTAAQNTIDTNRAAEQLAADGVAGTASVAEVVTAISEAEATLQTVVAVRDRIISAYQEILRMPI